MKLIGLMPVRNEDWILGLSSRVALAWCDELVILNHASTDRSVEIIDELMHEYSGRVHLSSVPELQWSEMEHRQMMLDHARIKGATHIAIVDADEILTANVVDQVKNAVIVMRDGQMLQLPGYNLRGGLSRYHSNGVWGNRLFSVAFKDYRCLGWRGDRHHAREPERPDKSKPRLFSVMQQGTGGVLHLWGASERRLIAKHRLYKMRDVLRWPGQREKIEREYSWAIKGEPSNPAFGTPASWTYADVPLEWWHSYKPWMKYLDIDAEPWQEAECRRLREQHGAEAFRGLDLFDSAVT